MTTVATTTVGSFETIDDDPDPPLPARYYHFDGVECQDDGGNDAGRMEDIAQKCVQNAMDRKASKPFFSKDSHDKKTLDDDLGRRSTRSNTHFCGGTHPPEPSANSSSPHLRSHDSSAIHILTEAYLVPNPTGSNGDTVHHEDGNHFAVDPTIPVSVEARPIRLQPWYKHRRTQCLIGVIVVLCVSLAGIVGITFRSGANDGDDGVGVGEDGGGVDGNDGFGVGDVDVEVEVGTESETLPPGDSNAVFVPSSGSPTLSPSLLKLEGVDEKGEAEVELEAEVEAGSSELMDLMKEEGEEGDGSLPPTLHPIQYAGLHSADNNETSPSSGIIPSSSTSTLATPNPTADNFFSEPPITETILPTSIHPVISTANLTNTPTSLLIEASSSAPITPPNIAMSLTERPTVPIPSTIPPTTTNPTTTPLTQESTTPSPAPSQTNPESCITIAFTTDEYSHETSWSLTSISNADQPIPTETIVASQPPDSYEPHQTVSERICLPDGTYRFTIRDRHGDGFGLGSEPYRLFLGDREILFGKFLSSEISHDIRIGYDVVVNATMTERERQWLVAHNLRRKEWHEWYNKTYVPLHWSPELAVGAAEWAEQLQWQCCCDDDNGDLAVSGMEGGENIRKTTGKGQMTLPEDVLKTWVDGKMMDFGTIGSGTYPANEDLTQVLWRATKYVGCGDSLKEFEDGSICLIQVCRYITPGNCAMGRYNASEGDNWLIPMLEDHSFCPPSCPSGGCF
ncbi:hypothetical protein ACHAXS_002513 [Conticribra weissflogii]